MDPGFLAFLPRRLRCTETHLSTRAARKELASVPPGARKRLLRRPHKEDRGRPGWGATKTRADLDQHPAVTLAGRRGFGRGSRASGYTVSRVPKRLG